MTEEGAREAVVVRRYGEYWQRTDPAACEREFVILGVLTRHGFPVPKPLLLDAQGGPFGAPTVVMTRLPGKPLLAPRDLSDYLEQIAATLARLHSLPVTEFGFLREQRVNVERTLDVFFGAPDDPLQVAVWSEAKAAWPRVANASREHSVVHGDFWPGNLLWVRGRLVSVVDWEQPRLGDPAKDVATCRGDISVLFGLDAADEFVRHYRNAGGCRIEELRFWDLLISTYAVKQIEEWATVYPVLGRPELTPAMARDRIREFAESAMAAS
jgi:aminoglycoside phosphotransferase (APT) family kinase protein